MVSILPSLGSWLRGLHKAVGYGVGQVGRTAAISVFCHRFLEASPVMYCKAVHIIRAFFLLIGDVNKSRLTIYRLVSTHNRPKKWAQKFLCVSNGEAAIEKTCKIGNDCII